MEHSSSEKIAEALRLLEEAAKDKKDELKSAMSNRYSHLKTAIVEAEHSLVKSVTDAGRHAAEAAAHARDVSVEKAREVAHDVDKSVHRNPWPYLAGTAVAGLMLGYFLGRRRR